MATNKRLIKSNDEAAGGASFNTIVYSGDGTSNNEITGVGFQPDLVWIKQRNGTASHSLQDSVRGAGQNFNLYSDNTAYEGQYGIYGYLSNFNINGFTVNAASGSHTNASGTDNYVAWCWKAGGDAVTNTDGTITSQVSANTEAGFSIVSYTGSGVNSNVGHGLEATPKMIIVKNREEPQNWLIWFDGFSSSQYLQFNTNAIGSFSNFWGGTHSDTVFNNGSGNYATVNQTGINYIAYCFAEVAGFSKFGSYTGNGSTNGPTVITGFEPAMIIIKQTSASGNNWNIIDNKRSISNPRDLNLWADTSDSETIASQGGLYDVDFLENGFQIKNIYFPFNASGETYIYMAFANQF